MGGAICTCVPRSNCSHYHCHPNVFQNIESDINNKSNDAVLTATRLWEEKRKPSEEEINQIFDKKIIEYRQALENKLSEMIKKNRQAVLKAVKEIQENPKKFESVFTFIQ